eukprot:7310014-Prymnesium_polylepis.1
MPPDNSEAIKTAVVQSPVAAASLMSRGVERSSARLINDHAREGAGRKVAVPAATGAPEGVRDGFRRRACRRRWGRRAAATATSDAG